MKIIAMIPARIGSQRLKKKNLALINNKPLVYYAINAAKKSKVFDKIFINSDSEIFEKISKNNKINFYLRPKKLGSSATKSDEVVYDFLKKNFCDILVWVNSIAPLQSFDEIKNAVNYFKKKKFNSLITTNKFFNHAIKNKKPLNFQTNSKFEKTQNLIPIELMVYTQMIWNSKSFIKSYEENGNGILHGKVGYFEVSKHSGMIIKYESDLKLASILLKKTKYKLRYYK